MKFAHRSQPSLQKLTFSLVIGCSALTLSTQFARAQDAPPPPPPPPAAATPAAPAPAPPTWSVGPIDFSGLVDGYYSFNANHPATSSGGNQLHNFDYDANAFSLNMAKLTMSHDPDPVGFRVDLGFGKAFNQILASEPNFKYLEQAFVSLKPTKGKGFEADFGEFVTSAGAEVIETKDNWNYSRSLLFALAIPYYHVGLRTSMPITKSFTGGVQVVNGWNNFTDNNSGKTVGFTGVYTKPKFVWSGTYYTGPENAGTNKGFRNLLDTVLTLTPTAKFSAYINYDYVQNRNAVQIDESGTNYRTGSLDHLQGIAFAARMQATNTVAFAGRFEYLADGSAQGGSVGTGNHMKINEFTLTGEWKIPEGLLARVEYRRDGVDTPYFNKGTSQVVKGQSVVDIGVVAFFGPKR
ncbi:MAG TPA: porin [Acidobacteriaceae bacterium]|nr:porin [Acidobacteriaceae bacterium]